HTSRSRRTPIRITRVSTAVARARRSLPLPFASVAVTTANPPLRPRWVTGMPARAGAATAEVTPGTTSNGTPARAHARASPAARLVGSARTDQLDQLLDVERPPPPAGPLRHVGQRGPGPVADLAEQSDRLLPLGSEPFVQLLAEPAGQGRRPAARGHRDRQV